VSIKYAPYGFAATSRRQKSALHLIGAKVLAGSVKLSAPYRISSVPSSGETCHGCETRISAPDRQWNVTFARFPTLRFHDTCVQLWQTLRTRDSEALVALASRSHRRARRALSS
jgi:hypothetical protein